MKSFTERYTQDEYILVEDIRKTLRFVRNDRFSGNYQPYQIRAGAALTPIGYLAKINGQEVSVTMYVRNTKLDFAIQVWEIAQDLTTSKYQDYWYYKWGSTDDPIKNLVFRSKNREKAEHYFQKLLAEIWDEEKITVSESAVFKRNEHVGFHTSDLRLEVCVDEEKITTQVEDQLRRQFSENKKKHPLDKKGLRYTYEEIEDYFVHVDAHLLSLLNAEDGRKEITQLEKELFESAEKLDLSGILSALEKGANVNAVDVLGDTALTKVIQADRFDSMTIENDEHYKKLRKEIPDFTDEEKMNVAQVLLEYGADINFFGYDGLNGLMYASYYQSPALMKFLLDRGANPNMDYFPDDKSFVVSHPLDNILSDFGADNDAEERERLLACERLLKLAGAK